MSTFKKHSLHQIKAGFTLVELMVVVSIIAIFVAIILVSISTARENTREKRRVADLAQIELALTLYKTKYGSYPNYSGTPNEGIEIGVGGPIDAALSQFVDRAFTDPLADAPGSGVGYGYWYSSTWNCTQSNQVILSAVTEQQKNANYDSLCTANPSSNDPTGYWAKSYVVLLKP